MSQLHKKFSDEQVKAILRNYQERQMTREHAQELLGVGKSHFFTLLQQYRADPTSMSIEYQRKAKGRISAEAEQIIRQELKREKDLVDDKRLPISS
jgi:transposase